MLTTGTVGLVTLTDTDSLLLPPTPVHDNVKVVSAVTLLMTSEPVKGRLPDQPPEAVQEFASRMFQLRVVEPPAETTWGAADSEIDGGCGAATVTDRVSLSMPLPESQLSTKVLSATSEPIASDPLDGFSPLQLPDAWHWFTSSVVQFSTMLPL